jgi:hypothetical protein
MEGKGCLFKKFAGIDVFDIEIDATDPDKIVEIVAALEPTFGGINLEDNQGTGVFHRRAQAARAHEDTGISRQSAYGLRGCANKAASHRLASSSLISLQALQMSLIWINRRQGIWQRLPKHLAHGRAGLLTEINAVWLPPTSLQKGSGC